MIEFLQDPIFRAPLLGALFMSLAASMVGSILLVKKRLLIGETLAHSAFPGVTLGVLLLLIFDPQMKKFAFFIPTCAGLSCCISLYFLEKLCKVKWIKSDSALTAVLAISFGLGVLVASYIQSQSGLLYAQATTFLYGQMVTMTSGHVWIYGVISLATALGLTLGFHLVRATSFDSAFSLSIGIRLSLIEVLFSLLIVLSVIIGIRSVGVFLMSGMFIAPPVAARQFSHRLAMIQLLSVLFGMASVLIGAAMTYGMNNRLPTGPVIVLVATCFAALSMVIAPKQGVIARQIRKMQFHKKCLVENFLKAAIKGEDLIDRESIRRIVVVSRWKFFFLLQKLRREGWIEIVPEGMRLTKDGAARGLRVVRLHRLWETYLVKELGKGLGAVHESAEQMEHILDCELEGELSKILKNPSKDPHSQTIPNQKDVWL